jgi:uncharacterized Zn-finger protein
MKYVCKHPNCYKAYNDKNDYKVHVKAMHDGKKHQCKICAKRFWTDGHLKDHVRIHMDDPLNDDIEEIINNAPKL